MYIYIYIYVSVYNLYIYIYMNKFIVVLPSVHLHKACPDKAGCRHTGATSEPDSPSPAGQWEHAEKEDHQQKRWAIETFPSALISSMQMNQSPSGRVELGPVQCTSVRDSIPPRRGGGPPSPPPCGGFDVLVLRLGRHHCSTYTSTSNPPEGGGKEGPPPLPGRRGRGGWDRRRRAALRACTARSSARL